MYLFYSFFNYRGVNFNYCHDERGMVLFLAQLEAEWCNTLRWACRLLPTGLSELERKKFFARALIFVLDAPELVFSK
jgi:hypothetical protein